MIIVMALVITMFNPSDNLMAATKKTTEKNYTIKGSTLTIKGKISRKTKFKNAKKKKKVVVKKGVKLLPAEPFKNLKKVKKLQVPGNLRFNYKEKEYGLTEWIYPRVVDTVEFTTPLTESTMYEYYRTKKFVVSKKDKKYCSIDGNIYNKHGTYFFAMPSETKELVIRDGCKTVNFDGFAYKGNNSKYYEDWSDDDYSICKKLKKVVIPTSVTEFTYNTTYFETAREAEYIFTNKVYNNENVKVLLELLGVDNFVKAFKEKITINDKFVIYNDTHLISYTGCEEIVNIPEGVVTAYEHSLINSTYNMIQQVNFPSTFKGSQNEIWTDIFVKRYNVGIRDYNNMEINVDGKERDFVHYYCKCKSEQLIKLNMTEDGVLSFDTYTHKSDDVCKIYDSKMNIIKPICSKLNIFTEVKKGDVIYLKVPKQTDKKNNLALNLNKIYIMPVNSVNLNKKGIIVKGTGKIQYFNFNIKKRTIASIGINKITAKNNPTVKIQKKSGNDWIDITKNIKNAKTLYNLVINKGEYRVCMVCDNNSYYTLGAFDNSKKEYGKAAKTKKKAINVKRSYYGGLAYEDGKTTWLKFDKKKKGNIIIWAETDVKSKITVQLYKKGQKKAIKKVTLDGVKKYRVDVKFGKRQYYIKVKRSDKKISCNLKVEVKL